MSGIPCVPFWSVMWSGCLGFLFLMVGSASKLRGPSHRRAVLILCCRGRHFEVCLGRAAFGFPPLWLQSLLRSLWILFSNGFFVALAWSVQVLFNLHFCRVIGCTFLMRPLGSFCLHLGSFPIPYLVHPSWFFTLGQF